jgi:hypothetical protein
MQKRGISVSGRSVHYTTPITIRCAARRFWAKLARSIFGKPVTQESQTSKEQDCDTFEFLSFYCRFLCFYCRHVLYGALHGELNQ